MRKILIGIVVLSFIGCTQQEMTKEYWDNGNLKSEGFLNDTTKTGVWKLYNPQNELKQKGKYLNGEKEGLWFFYTSSNSEHKRRLWSHDFYKNGEEMYSVQFGKDGKIKDFHIYDKDGFYLLSPNEDSYIEM